MKAITIFGSLLCFLLFTDVSQAQVYSCGSSSDVATACAGTVYCQKTIADVTTIEKAKNGQCPAGSMPRKADTADNACKIARDMSMYKYEQFTCPAEKCPVYVDDTDTKSITAPCCTYTSRWSCKKETRTTEPVALE